MLIAEATVATQRPRRYLTQLCRHIKLVSQLHPQQRAHVEWSDDHGVINIGSGRCTLQAGPGVLTLRAKAPDAQSLDLLQQRVASRLEQAGRRDGLAVTWRVAGVDNDWMTS